MSAFSASDAPKVGAYGFDWLKPKITKCRQITAADSKHFKNCDQNSSGFGGSYTPTHKCRVNDRSEWFIYSTKFQCQEELDTMQANGE